MNGYPYDRLRHLQPSTSFRTANLSSCVIATVMLLPIASMGSRTAQSSVTSLVHGDVVLRMPHNNDTGLQGPPLEGWS